MRFTGADLDGKQISVEMSPNELGAIRQIAVELLQEMDDTDLEIRVGRSRAEVRVLISQLAEVQKVAGCW